ncbi:hypothetical protein BH10BDE1_BH10BDE1_17710 [soil metagenome]
MKQHLRNVFGLTLAVLAAALFTSVNAQAGTAESPGESPAASLSDAQIKMRIPHELRGFAAIPVAVKTALDNDFRSRYPVAAPTGADVIEGWVDTYSQSKIRDPYGAFDTRHYFRVIVRHTDGIYVYLDINVYQRATFEPDQDPIFIESFQVAGWQR